MLWRPRLWRPRLWRASLLKNVPIAITIAITIAVSIVLTTAASSVGAAPKRVAVVGVQIGGDGAPELQAQLATSVVSGLAAAQVKTIDLDDVREALRETPELLGCISSTCLARIGEKLGADGFVRAKVQAEGADYTIELELYNTKELIHRVEKACTVCTIGELNALTKSTATLLVQGASDSPLQVVIRTEPSGAEITIDGLSRGTAPFEGPLSPGPHLLVAKSPSGKEVRKRIEVNEESASVPMVIHIEDPVVAVPPPPIPPSSRGLLKWGAVGGALSATALGITLIVVDGRGTCGESDKQCPRELNTLPAGLVSLGVGAAFAGLAGYLFWSESKSSGKRVEPAVSVSSNGTQLGVRVSF